MAYTRRYHTVIPLEPDADLKVTRWLVRESFERKAAGDCLIIVDYTEATLSADDIPPKAAKQLPRPIAEYQWVSFEAVATVAVADA